MCSICFANSAVASLPILVQRRLMAAKQTLSRLSSGPFSKRGFEQTFPILFFKKCEKRERQADACLSGCYNGLVLDFGLVSFLVNLNDPFRIGFGIAIDFFVALLFNELISGIVERPNKRVNARRRRLFCHHRPCRLHRRGNSDSLLSDKPACRVNK